MTKLSLCSIAEAGLYKTSDVPAQMYGSCKPILKDELIDRVNELGESSEMISQRHFLPNQTEIDPIETNGPVVLYRKQLFRLDPSYSGLGIHYIE